MDTELKELGFDFLRNIRIKDREEIEAWEKQEREERIRVFHQNCGMDSEFFGAKIDYEKYPVEMKKKLYDFVENVRNKKGGFLILNGAVGTGKTSAAAAVMNELLMGTYLDMLELELKLNTADRFSNNSGMNREQYMHSLASCSLLVLDEIGRFPDRRQFEQPILFYLLNRRYQNKRPTVLCTNMSSKEFADFMGQAIIDRIRSNRIRIELNGKSLR